VAADGARRRLGAFSGASWSAQGRYVIAWRGRELTALEPDGDARWSLSAPARVTQASWSPVDGYRIAYVAGASLRVVNGDGTGDRRYAPARPVAPAWRPDAAHVLAYVDRRERVRLVAVDSGRRLWRTRPFPGITRLVWSPDGSELLALADGEIVRFDPRRQTHRTSIPQHRPGAAWRVEDIAVGPRRLALVRASTSGRREVSVVRAAASGRRQASLVGSSRERVLFTAPGRLGGLAWSPDGTRLLVSWPDADQWLFLRPYRGGRPVAVANIARQFMPGTTGAAFPDAVQWCCAAP
jgi:hypothetical protein